MSGEQRHLFLSVLAVTITIQLNADSSVVMEVWLLEFLDIDNWKGTRSKLV